MSEVVRIRLEFEPARDTISVTNVFSTGASETFRVPEDALSSLFANRWTTGFMPVNGDGIVYVEEREGIRVAVVQRALKKDVKIHWNDYRNAGDHLVTTPWTYMVFRLAPSGIGYTRAKENLYIGTGPCLGANTPLYHAGAVVGNVYDVDRGYSSTNICWGNAAVAPNGVVTLASLVNLASDFYTQPFTNHVQHSLEPWKNFTKTEKLPTQSICTLGEAIRKVWDNR